MRSVVKIPQMARAAATHCATLRCQVVNKLQPSVSQFQEKAWKGIKGAVAVEEVFKTGTKGVIIGSGMAIGSAVTGNKDEEKKQDVKAEDHSKKFNPYAIIENFGSKFVSSGGPGVCNTFKRGLIEGHNFIMDPDRPKFGMS